MTFVAAAIDPSEGPDVVRGYVRAQGYPWTVVALADRPVLERYHVVSTALKYAVNRRGTITFTRGYGVENAATWEQVLEELARS